MIELIPPRRDPRLLVLDARRDAVRHAAIDPWELSALGRIGARSPRALAHGLARLALSARPSHVVVAGPPRLPRAVTALLARRGVPVVPLDRATARALLADAPALPELRAAHAELRGIALGGLARVVRLAASALLHLALSPRHYVPRQPARAAAAVAPRRARRRAPPPSAAPAPGRGPRP